MNKLVYIAGPYTANTKLGVEANINEARKAAVWCAEHRIFYICPHLNSAHLELWAPEVSVKFYYSMDLEILSRCDGILLLDGWSNSKGATAELKYAVDNQKEFFYFNSEQTKLLRWYGGLSE